MENEAKENNVKTVTRIKKKKQSNTAKNNYNSFQNEIQIAIKF